MPAKPKWLLRLPEIIADLAALETPLIDRAVIERLFEVKRRRAIELANHFGGYQAGRTFLVDRVRLIEDLKRIQAGEEFRYERRRRERLAEALDKIRKHRTAAAVTVRLECQDMNLKLADLPAGVRLEPGRLTVDFNGVEDLLKKLYGLGQAAQNDFERFAAAAGSA